MANVNVIIKIEEFEKTQNVVFCIAVSSVDLYHHDI